VPQGVISNTDEPDQFLHYSDITEIPTKITIYPLPYVSINFVPSSFYFSFISEVKMKLSTKLNN